MACAEYKYCKVHKKETLHQNNKCYLCEKKRIMKLLTERGYCTEGK